MELSKHINLISLFDTSISLLAAFVLGGLIGLERQYRQRTAGLRTNVLVSVGSAFFVDIANNLGGPQGAIHVIAYVVSGIGFLGAGVIMREGGNIRGLNTAATLWGSAAIGAAAGADLILEAAIGTGFVLFASTLLRPLVNRINKQPIDMSTSEVSATIYVVADKHHQKIAMSALSQHLDSIECQADDLNVHPFGDNDVEIEAKMIATSIDNQLLDHVVDEMIKLDYVRQSFWTPSTSD